MNSSPLTSSLNIFDLENRIDDLFDLAHPIDKEHPNERLHQPLLESAITGFVTDDRKSRSLQTNREYVKVDFQDFMDYATSGLPQQLGLRDFPNKTVIFYESIAPTLEPTPDAVWGER